MKPKAYLPYLLILSLVTTCVEVDISVPSFPQISEYFQVADNIVQLTISLNFLAYCLGALLYGPLSDAFGRRKLMIMGNGILTLGALGCVWAPSIDFLLISRFIQGLGASTSVVIAFAMIADAYEGEIAMKLFGLTNAFLSISMAFAPVIGGLINAALGWRGNYGIVAVLSVISWLLLLILLPETKKQMNKFSIKEVVGAYKQLLSSGKFLQTSFILSLFFAGYMAYIATSSFLYMNTFGVGMMAFVANQAVIISAFAVTSLSYGRIVKYIDAESVTKLGVLLCLLSAVGVISVSFYYPLNEKLFTLTMSLFSIGFAVSYPFIFNQSLSVFPAMYGAASSLMMSVRAALVFIFTLVAGLFFNGSAISVAIPVIIGICAGFLLALAFFNKKIVTDSSVSSLSN